MSQQASELRARLALARQRALPASCAATPGRAISGDALGRRRLTAAYNDASCPGVRRNIGER